MDYLVAVIDDLLLRRSLLPVASSRVLHNQIPSYFKSLLGAYWEKIA
jgi:hypothetical protein